VIGWLFTGLLIAVVCAVFVFGAGRVHAATVNGLHSTRLPASVEPTEAEQRAQMADDWTHYWSDYQAAARMPRYDPEYDWASDPRGWRS
jgi:hypothetical protein